MDMTSLYCCMKIYIYTKQHDLGATVKVVGVCGTKKNLSYHSQFDELGLNRSRSSPQEDNAGRETERTEQEQKKKSSLTKI
jgi:hypothetical protein